MDHKQTDCGPIGPAVKGRCPSTCGRKKRRLYPQQTFDQALESVRKQKMNVARASVQFGVPSTTLRNHIVGRYTSFTTGPPRSLRDEDETELVDYLKYSQAQGFPLTRLDVRKIILNVQKQYTKPSFNTEKGPSDKWFRSFFARHPEVQEGKQLTSPKRQNFCVICDFERRSSRTKLESTEHKLPKECVVRDIALVAEPGVFVKSESVPRKASVQQDFSGTDSKQENPQQVLCDHLIKEAEKTKIKVVRSRQLYLKSDFVEALEMIRDKQMSINEASKHYGIPDSTIRGHINGRHTNMKTGPQRQLSDEQEECVVSHIMSYAPLSRAAIRKFIMKMLADDGKLESTNFNIDRGPSNKWFKNFYKRHPDLRSFEDFARDASADVSSEGSDSDESDSCDVRREFAGSATNILEQEFSIEQAASNTTPVNKKRLDEPFDTCIVPTKKRRSLKKTPTSAHLESPRVGEGKTTVDVTKIKTGHCAQVRSPQLQMMSIASVEPAKNHITPRSFGRKRGPKRTLDEEDEEVLVDLLRNSPTPVKRADIRKMVLDLVRAKGKISSTTFNIDRGPSDKWFRAFYARHPELLEGEDQRDSSNSVCETNLDPTPGYMESGSRSHGGPLPMDQAAEAAETTATDRRQTKDRPSAHSENQSPTKGDQMSESEKPTGGRSTPSQPLSQDDEEVLVYYLKNCTAPLTRGEIRQFTMGIVMAKARLSSNTCNVLDGPDDLWFKGFYERHPDLLTKEQPDTSKNTVMVNWQTLKHEPQGDSEEELFSNGENLGTI